MEPRVSLITLGVPDLAAARAFYVDGLGWAPMLEVPGHVLFLQVGHGLALSLFGAQDLVDDATASGAGGSARPDGSTTRDAPVPDGPATPDEPAAPNGPSTPAEPLPTPGWTPADGPRGFTLAHNVGSPAEVDAVLVAAVAAGGRLVKPAQHAEWGGYHGYVADPAGTLWEIAHNPSWAVAADGTVQI